MVRAPVRSVCSFLSVIKIDKKRQWTTKRNWKLWQTKTKWRETKRPKRDKNRDKRTKKRQEDKRKTANSVVIYCNISSSWLLLVHGSYWFLWCLLSQIFIKKAEWSPSPHSAIPQLLQAGTQGSRPAPVLLTRSPPRCRSAAVWPDLAAAGLSSSDWTHRLWSSCRTQKNLYLCTYSEVNVENTGNHEAEKLLLRHAQTQRRLSADGRPGPFYQHCPTCRPPQ